VFDIIGKINWFFLFSGLILVPGLIFIGLTPATNGKVGLKFSIDYTGGTEWQIQFKNPDVTAGQINTILIKDGVTDAEISEDTANNFTIKTKRYDLIPAPTAKPTVNPSAAKSAAASASASAGASATAVAAASASASAEAQATATAQASASASAAAASPTPTLDPSASASVAAAAQASASAQAQASASAAAAASASAADASASASVAAQPTPVATPVPNSVSQTGQPCQLHLPTSGLLAKLATQFAADKSIGAITCTGLQSTVGPVVSAELIQQAVLLILIGSLGILIWIGIRFGSIKFGATALAALLHDVIVVVGIFAILGTLFGVQIDALFVTAMLTVIGFSVHDTIVVYDRIRENKARHAGEPFDLIVNHSILQTFGRSINTSLTVVVTLTALLLFAGASIHYFVLALLIGIISGTYSSIFNASPLLVVWQLWEDRRRAERLAALRGGRRT
jgi:preprotein translocase SecF subunit